ncbi:MAG TPA: serine/threonine-protein kinase [Polyangiaceae bacterium]|nr:serine/threonine-protein kinase [Polyangiaceae bacterium]
MLQEGQVFAGRYRVEARIAQGGMGVIYAAEHMATEEQVALKVLWPHVLGSGPALENFQLEARIAARLASEHIVRIFDAGVDEAQGLPYLAMERLRGQTLEALVTEAGPRPAAEVLELTRQVAAALDKAHGYVDREGRPSPIVHRDLKPENLFLVRREGGEPLVKVLDFGMAKVLSGSHKLSQELRGTPLFMASEQVSGGPVTPRLDVWALGLIVFYLLTGRFYWRSANEREGTMMRLLNEVGVQPLEPPSDRARSFAIVPPWPPAFDAWFSRCVNRDVDARFPSAGAAVAALAEALGLSRASVSVPPPAPSGVPTFALASPPLVVDALATKPGFLRPPEGSGQTASPVAGRPSRRGPGAGRRAAGLAAGAALAIGLVSLALGRSRIDAILHPRGASPPPVGSVATAVAPPPPVGSVATAVTPPPPASSNAPAEAPAAPRGAAEREAREGFVGGASPPPGESARPGPRPRGGARLGPRPPKPATPATPANRDLYDER